MSDYDSGYMDGKAVMYERIAELESDNRRIKKVMQRYIDCQDNAKNNWVLDFLQVLEEEK